MIEGPRNVLVHARAYTMPWVVVLLLAGCGDEGCNVAPAGEDGSTSSPSSSGGSTAGGDTSSSDAQGSSGGSDGTSGTDGSNAAPVATDDVVYATQDTASSWPAAVLLDNDIDGDGDVLTVIDIDASSSSGAVVELAADGTITYTPVPGFWGVDSVSYSVGDGVGSATGAVTIHVAPKLLQLADVAAGRGGFVIDGELAQDRAGAALSAAADVDGDGLADVVIGAPAADPHGESSGRSYVVFGKADTGAVALADVAAGDGGFALLGAASYDQAGAAVSGDGDVDGDGRGDVIVGARGADPNGAASGRSYVVFGKPDGAAIELDAVASGGGGFAIDGEVTLDGSGRSVALAGDVNGDGLDDLVVGAYRADPSGYASGRCYVVFGKPGGGTVEASAVVEGNGGFAIDGEGEYDFAGWAVAGGGDVNGDGFADVLIAARDYPSGQGFGRSYVVFGKADGATVSLAAIAAGDGGFALDGESDHGFGGNALQGLGDVDGDGLDDLIIAAYHAGPGAELRGRSYVVFGRTDTGLFSLADVGDGVDGFAIDGEAPGDRSGNAVGAAGDVNGDGRMDIIVGAAEVSAHGVSRGRAYVIYGKADHARVDLSAVAMGSGGFAIEGENLGDNAGIAVGGAGDVDGDGLDDILVGAHGVDAGGRVDAGRAYVVFGVRTDPG